MSNEYNSGTKIRDEHPQIAEFHRLMGMHLRLTELERKNYIKRMSAALRSAYTKHFSPLHNQKSILKLDNLSISPRQGSIDLKVVFSDALTLFEGAGHSSFCVETDKKLSEDEKAALMTRLHRALYAQYKKHFVEDKNTLSGSITCFGIAIKPTIGEQVDLNRFSADVLNMFI